jgi:hypothetical protein
MYSPVLVSGNPLGVTMANFTADEMPVCLAAFSISD